MEHRRFFGPGNLEFIKQNCIPVVHRGGNGLYLCTAQGKILEPREWPNTRLGDIARGVELFKKLPESERKPKDVFQPIRVALAGSTISPGIFESLAVLGKSEAVRRIDAALALA